MNGRVLLNRRARLAAAIVATLVIAATAGAANGLRDTTAPVLAAELRHLEQAIGSTDPGRLSTLGDALPDGWRIRDGDHEFVVPSNPIRSALKESGAGAIDRAVAQVTSLRESVEGFQTPAPDARPSRSLLTDILSQREFRDLHGPTWMQRLQARILRWLEAIFGRLLVSSVVPTLTRGIVYALMAAAVAAFAWWAFRTLRSRVREDSRVTPDDVPVRAKEWTAWLADAEQAAAAGDWRSAVHAAYWCAVSFLESNGAWRIDRARTPREYAALLPSSNPAREPLTSITREFERTWYGGAAADADTFARARMDLRSLGCPAA